MSEARTIVEGCYVRGGRIELDDRFRFNMRVKHYPDGRASIRLGPPMRSDEANNYMWLILGLIEEATKDLGGHSAEDYHEYFKAHFIPKRVALTDGNGEIVDDIVVGGSTTKLSSRDFYDYVEKIRQWAIERLGLVTPDPDPKLSKKWKRYREEAARKTA